MASIVLALAASILLYKNVMNVSIDDDQLFSKECDIAEFIANNADILYRIMMIESHNTSTPIYQYELTRCFNTVYVLLSLMIGKEQTSNIIDHCWVRSNQTGYDDNLSEVNTLLDLFNSRTMSKGRYIYFININAFSMIHANNSSRHSVFPGHVFLIEQYAKRNEEDTNSNANSNAYTVHYRLYQSYLRNYTLKEYLGKREHFDISYDEIINLFNDLKTFYSSGDIWNDIHRSIWKKFTLVDINGLSRFSIVNMRFCSYACSIDDVCQLRTTNLLDKYIVICKKFIDEHKKQLMLLDNNTINSVRDPNQQQLIVQMIRNNESTKVDDHTIVDPILLQRIDSYRKDRKSIDEHFDFISPEFKIESVYGTSGIKTEELLERLLELQRSINDV